MAYTDTLTLFRGDDRALTGVIRDAVGNPVDITGWSFWCTAKSALTVADPGQFQLASASGAIVLTTPGSGVITINLPGSASSGLTSEQAFFVDVQGKDAAGKIKTLYTGKWTFVLDTTQATS